jgi:hypothetical protein
MDEALIQLSYTSELPHLASLFTPLQVSGLSNAQLISDLAKLRTFVREGEVLFLHPLQINSGIFSTKKPT